MLDEILKMEAFKVEMLDSVVAPLNSPEELEEKSLSLRGVLYPHLEQRIRAKERLNA